MFNSPGSPPAPPPPTYPVGMYANQFATHRTSGVAIFGGFVAAVGCAILAFIQFLSGLLGLAFDSPTRPQTATELRYGQIWESLWETSFFAGMMTILAFVLTIVALSDRQRRIIRWVLLPLTVNFVLCVATWIFGLASVPA